jgi:multidrug transporter EmrE-like cation transporter
VLVSKVDVSQAYPAVALGIVITAAAGYFLLGEAINPTRAAGIVLIISGVVAVAVS